MIRILLIILFTTSLLHSQGRPNKKCCENCGGSSGGCTDTFGFDNREVCQEDYPYPWNGINIPTAGNYQAVLENAAGCDSVATLTATTYPELTLDGMSTPETCNADNTADGTITWSAMGGTPSYNYSPGENQTGLSAGTYSATVTDSNGCTATGEADVLDSNICMPNCVDVTTNIEINSCPEDYSYSWNGLTISASGMYDVTLSKADGCDSTVILTDNTLPSPSIQGVVTDETCNNDSTQDGAIDITHNGISQVWSTTETTEDITGLSTGNYTVTVTDANGCTASESFTVGDLDDCCDCDISLNSYSYTDNCTSQQLTFDVEGTCGDFTWQIRIDNPPILGGPYTVAIGNHNNSSGNLIVDASCFTEYEIFGPVTELWISQPGCFTTQIPISVSHSSTNCIYGKVVLDFNSDCAMTSSEYCSSGITGAEIQLWRQNPCTGLFEEYAETTAGTFLTPPFTVAQGMPQEWFDCWQSSSGAGGFLFCDVPCGNYFMRALVPSNLAPVLPCSPPSGTTSYNDYDNDGSNDAISGGSTTYTFTVSGGNIFDYSFGFEPN